MHGHAHGGFTLFLEFVSLITIFCAVVYPLLLAVFYWNTNKLGRRHAMNFIGDAYTMSVTFIFGVLMLFGFLANLPEWVQALMRISMGGVMVYCTHRLSTYLRREVLKKEDASLWGLIKDVIALLRS